MSKKAKKQRDKDGRFWKGNTTGFQKGNDLWRLIDKPSAIDRKFKSPEELWEKCCEYFEWCSNNPIEEQKVFASGVKTDLSHARPMTLKGLQLFIGLTAMGWDVYGKREEFKEVYQTVKDIIYDQKFSGAAVGIFNPIIISRDLGLAEKQVVDSSTTVHVIDNFNSDEGIPDGQQEPEDD